MKLPATLLMATLLCGLCACTTPPAPTGTATLPNGLRMDITEVTVGSFGAFVKATGYRTTADSLGWSGCFDTTIPGWVPVQEANWAYPDGHRKALPQEPVTHISYYDACAYCRWKNGRLPSAQEWDAALGLDDQPGNVWEGPFPMHDSGADGFVSSVAPVGQFQPNPHGLYDLLGNVWEWTSTPPSAASRQGTAFFAQGADTLAIRGGKIIKGGSFLCDLTFCAGFIPERYQVAEEDSGLNHLGFRCVYDE